MTSQPRKAPEEKSTPRHEGALARELAQERRLSKALDGLVTAMATSKDLESLLQRLVALFAEAAAEVAVNADAEVAADGAAEIDAKGAADVDVVHAPMAVLCLREGDKLRSHASFGVAEGAGSDFILPLDTWGVMDAFHALDVQNAIEDHAPLLLSPAASQAIPLRAPNGERADVLYFLPLHDDGQLVGAVYLGYVGPREPRTFSDTDTHIFTRLARGAAAAIVHHIAPRIGRSRSDVLSVVAHDLQNPITVISIAANTLLQRLSESSVRRPIERIIRSAHRAARLIQDLQEIDAVETGRFSIEIHPIEPTEAILAAVESQQNLAADASVILATDLSPDLPRFDADEERLFEVLENLVGNAIKFTPPGGSITVGAAPRQGEILIWVKDTGAGISPEQMPHIFDRFWQAKKADRRGTGLGLTICKAIVEAHGGRIWAESAPLAGTTMYFTIPAPGPRRDAREDAYDVANILLVDDRPENLLALEAILARPGYRLLKATSGEDALRLALRESFSVALIDIAMPAMNGLEVAVHLKALERSRDIPIIFVTAFGDDPQEIHRAYSAGGADYLVKPLDAEIVRKKVAVFVDLSRKRRDNPVAKHRSSTSST